MITGLSYYRSVPLQQHEKTCGVFCDLLSRVRPARLLEIGTRTGGFTLMLADVCGDAAIRTYDILQSPNQELLLQRGIDSRVGDVFALEKEIGAYIQQPGKTMVLCDGGDKPREVKTFAPYLKPGDHILAHDYAADAEIFERDMRGQRWNWCEIVDADIAETIAAVGLEPYIATQLAAVAWGSWRRTAEKTPLVMRHWE